MTRTPASLSFRLIVGAAAIALVAVFAALLAAYGAAETARRIEQSVAAQHRIDMLSTLSARIGDYAVVAVEASSNAVPTEAGKARLRSSALLVDEALARIDTAIADAAAEVESGGEVQQMRLATRSLVLARMRAQFQALTRAVMTQDQGQPLRPALDSFAIQFSPLLNEAIGGERRDRDAAAATVADLRTRMIWLAIGAGVAAGALVILFHIMLIRPLIARLDRAGQAAGEIGQGAFDVALPVAHRDELGQLFEAMNGMAAQLKRRRDAVNADQARLNKTIDIRTTALSEANERLSRIDADRRRFFADVGHELRTPLTVILAESELGLADGVDHVDAEKALSALSIIRSRALRLSRRIDDLLRVARSETGQIELDAGPFDLAEAVSDAVADMAPLAKRRHVTLTNRLDPAPAMGDRDWCRQVASGLIENAIRHSPADAAIEVACGTDGSEALLTVTDAGEGLPDGEAERVFERFARGAREATGSGFGVGLALARWVIERQSGTVALVSPAPRGPGGGITRGPGTQAVLRLPMPVVADQTKNVTEARNG